MGDNVLAGLLIVLCGGLFQGSFLAPSKWIRRWEWENYWLIFAASAYLICPWVMAISSVPRLWETYAGSDWRPLLKALGFGIGWGIGAVTFGLGVDAIGLALGFAVILGVAATAGTIIPLIYDPPAQLSTQQITWIGLSLVVMLAGVGVCSYAGKWKEAASKGERRMSYYAGVTICVVSGLLSSCGGLAFAFSKELQQRALERGAPPVVAANVVLPLLGLALFTCNAGYALYLQSKHGTAGQYRNAFVRNFLLSFSMGVMWLVGMLLYGAGSAKLGALGPSLGWAILMSSMVLVANVLGLLTGEWKGAPAASRRQLALGVLLLMLAISGLGYANQLQTKGEGPDGSQTAGSSIPRLIKLLPQVVAGA